MGFVMNIFATSPCPIESAVCLPDRHIVKMPVECCQMLSIVASAKWGHGYGDLSKSDQTPYKTDRGAFRNHPCTKWALESVDNTYWLIQWGLNLSKEYHMRYNKTHSCYATLTEAYDLFPKGNIINVTAFARAMPDEFKFDTSIDTFTAYKKYIASKHWVASNYLRIPERKPIWLQS